MKTCSWFSLLVAKRLALLLPMARHLFRNYRSPTIDVSSRTLIHRGWFVPIVGSGTAGFLGWDLLDSLMVIVPTSTLILDGRSVRTNSYHTACIPRSSPKGGEKIFDKYQINWSNNYYQSINTVKLIIALHFYLFDKDFVFPLSSKIYWNNILGPSSALDSTF